MKLLLERMQGVDLRIDAEYDAWFRRKVEAGEKAYREGRFITQAEATQRAKRRQATLIPRLRGE